LALSERIRNCISQTNSFIFTLNPTYFPLYLILGTIRLLNDPDDPEPFRKKFEIGEVEFRTSVEKTYLKMQKFLNR
jgi:hypothetical protein